MHEHSERVQATVLPKRGDPQRQAALQQTEEVERVEALAGWLDRLYLDPLVGFLLPGLGDIVTSAIGLYAVKVAIARRLPVAVIGRMFVNLAVDALIGAIPVIGDIFDAFFKAHTRNARLLRERHATRRATAGDWAIVVVAALAFCGALTVPLLVLVGLLGLLF